jgi:hypothetical protein
MYCIANDLGKRREREREREKGKYKEIIND